MTTPTEIPNHNDFLKEAAGATSTKAVRDLLARLPIAEDSSFAPNEPNSEEGWRSGFFHWYPVGRDRGNAGRIKLAGAPENPLAERTINAMEALVELERQREIRTTPGSQPPQNPRDAVQRYFSLPPLDQLPLWTQAIKGKKPKEYARELAKRIRLRLIRSTRPVEYAVIVEDDGIGQGAANMHSSLLSLGRSDKADKPYLIGVFGQGGSSAYAASDFSWLMSRRAPDLIGSGVDSVGWTVVKRIAVPGRRDVYWAYLAAHPDGRVPQLSAEAADKVQFKHGTRIAHLNYNFGKTEPARTLYQSLNHLIFNPVLPYELYTGPERRPDPMWGNGYRLSNLNDDKKALDKNFSAQQVEVKTEAAS